MNAQSNNAIKNTFNKGRNTIYQGYQSFSALSTLSQIFTSILGFLFLILVIYIIYYLYSSAQYDPRSAPLLIGKPVNAFDENLSKTTTRLPSASEGLAFTYNYWMYIADWQYKFGEEKVIFIKGQDANKAPKVFLYPKKNSMGVRMVTFADPNGEGCDIDNIPLQKWVNIAVVLDNRTMDIYVDGRLERSCALRGVPKLNKNELRFAPGGGFYGQLSKFRYFNRAITPDEAHSIYTDGPY